MHNENNCPGCHKELSLTPGNYPVASFYGPALCTCQGKLQTFPEIFKAVSAAQESTKIVSLPSGEQVA